MLGGALWSLSFCGLRVALIVCRQPQNWLRQLLIPFMPYPMDVNMNRGKRDSPHCGGATVFGISNQYLV